MRARLIRGLSLALMLGSMPTVWAQPAPPAAASAPDVARGKHAYAMCATCHGERGEGQASIDVPALGGQLPSYVERQLRAYRAGLRGAHPDDVPGNRMRMLARSIPDEALIADLAAHIASLPAAPSDRAIAGHVPSGRRLYQAQCAACHGPGGEGQAVLNAPRLSGLGDQYVYSQLRHFKLDRRAAAGNETGQQMTQLARTTLRDERAMRDVVAYLATLAR